MDAAPWLQLGLGGGALFLVLAISIVLYRVVMRVVEPLRSIASSLDGVRSEIGGVRERVARIEGKLDSHFDWTPVDSPKVNPQSSTYHQFKRPDTYPGQGAGKVKKPRDGR